MANDVHLRGGSDLRLYAEGADAPAGFVAGVAGFTFAALTAGGAAVVPTVAATAATFGPMTVASGAEVRADAGASITFSPLTAAGAAEAVGQGELPLSPASGFAGSGPSWRRAPIAAAEAGASMTFAPMTIAAHGRSVPRAPVRAAYALGVPSRVA